MRVCVCVCCRQPRAAPLHFSTRTTVPTPTPGLPPLPPMGYAFANAWVQGTVDIQTVTFAGLDQLLELDLMRPVDRYELRFCTFLSLYWNSYMVIFVLLRHTLQLSRVSADEVRGGGNPLLALIHGADMNCRHSLRFDALLQRLRVSATMRVRLAPGTAVDPMSPDDSNSDSNSGTPTSDSAASRLAPTPADGQSDSDSDSDGGVVVRTVTISMALTDARVASTLLLAVQAKEASALQVCDAPLRREGESIDVGSL